MKLSEILGRILTDYELRQEYTRVGVCHIVSNLAYGPAVIELSAEECEDAYNIVHSFSTALRACRQTDWYAYPVAPAGCPKHTMVDTYAASRSYCAAAEANPAGVKGNMWRGEYGQNRRRLVRDCWRWAKERGL